MAEPIRNARLNDLVEAPTPQNTPAAASSFISRASDGKPNVSTIREESDAPGGLSNNLALLSMIEGKLGNLVEHRSSYIENLPESVRNRIRGLKAIQAEHATLEGELEAEILELEKKWHKRYQPLYEKRNKIVNGQAEPTAEEIQDGKEIEQAEQEEDEETPRLEEITEEEETKEETEPVTGIPDFWSTALKNVPIISDGISERDEEALHFLTDVRMEYLSEEPGFKLIFEFSENPFFSNTTLTKTYIYASGQGFGGEFTLESAEGSSIAWKSADQNLTIKIEKRKQRNKHTKATRTIEKTVPELSFFSFFSPPSFTDLEDIPEEAEFDYQAGEAIKDMIPRAIDWYTGIALQYESDYDAENDEDNYEAESDEEEEDDEDNEDNEDYDEKNPKGKGDAPECKQQ